MKPENKSHSTEEVNWKYFPNIHQLSQYLPQPDLIQLSSTCSRFRNNLSSKIFRKLELIKDGDVIPGKANIASRKKQLKILIDLLEDDYLDKYHYVKHCIFWKPCNNSFVTRLFNTFTSITKLELYLTGININSYTSSLDRSSYLTQVLKPLRKLEVLVLDCKLISCLDTESVPDFKLPLSLKVLDIVGYKYDSLRFNLIESINGEYTELRKVSIINSKMLANISGSITTLTEVDILDIPDVCARLLTQLFTMNTQLKKITISLRYIESKVINSILKLKKLNRLNITYFSDENTNELKNLAFNTSIKHLNINCDITQNILLPILSSIKSLHTLELSEGNISNFCDIEWSLYNTNHPLLYLNSVYDYTSDYSNLLNSNIFDKIKFFNTLSLRYYVELHSFKKYNNWRIIQDDPSNERDFYLVRKHDEVVNRQ